MEPQHSPTANTRAGSAAPLLEVSLITNGVSWYLRSRLAVGRAGLTVATPRTVLGLVPVGTRRLEAPLGDVEAIALGVGIRLDRLAAAGLLTAALVTGRLERLPAVFVGVGAIALVLLGVHAAMKIRLVDRAGLDVPVCLAHLSRARRFIAGVESRLSAAGLQEG